ncbi:MAG: AraC family transcriptional regulator [Peptoniphilus sp.]|uniref:AraC family transcriptional regulator n=1 Tax=Peptoniphilus sp. TaxID=1971214 RepID=UPI002A74E976|nr:AraC family transcriptional regulator [Peptoniphilus sp.]MDY2987460.1 AraC family transcriptional regulator [Peptoniphilus sp.]
MKITDIEIPFYIEENTCSTKNKNEELAHWHNSIEIIKVIEGKFTCQVNGKNLEAQAGDVCVINRRKIHRILNDSSLKICKKKTFIFNPDILFKDETMYKKYMLPMLSDNGFSHMRFRYKSSLSKEILNLINEIEEIYNSKPLGYEMEITSIMIMILRRLYIAYQTSNETIKDRENPNIQIQRKMSGFIYENFGSKISLDDIANSGSVSKSTCMRIFKEYTGKSPIEFLNSYRLERSAQMLEETSALITEISLECGFSQQSYYNKLFLKEYGLTPKNYRKLFRTL